MQRDNIFHTRFHVQNKVCSVIFDGGSFTSVSSTTLVEKLGFSTSGPWKYDWTGNHDSFKNHFSFLKDKNLITLVPLTPKQVYEDQVRLKQECDTKKNEKESEQKKMSEKRVNKTKRVNKRKSVKKRVSKRK